MDWHAFRVSMHAALLATAIITVLGVALGYLLAKTRFRGRSALESVLTLPIALPPTVMGYYLLVQLGSPGPVNDLTHNVFGQTVTFTFTGVVIAQTIEAFPYCLRAARGSIAAVDPRLEQAARTTGMPEWQIALRVTLPLARRGIGVGIALGFGRALGDYAATVMVGGLGPHTTTMSTALYEAIFSNSGKDPAKLAGVQLLVAVAIMLFATKLARPREH